MVPAPIPIADARERYNGQPADNFTRSPVWVLCHEDMTPHAFAVYHALAIHHGKRGIWAGEQRIAAIAHVSVRQVRRSLQLLEQIGAIAMERRPGRTSQYRLLTPASWAGGAATRAGVSGLTGRGSAATQADKPDPSEPDPSNQRKELGDRGAWKPECRTPSPFDHLINRFESG